MSPCYCCQMTLGSQIRVARNKRGITQLQLAHRAQLSIGTVYGLEADRIKKGPDLATVLKLAAELGASFEFESRGKLVEVRVKGKARGEP